MPTINTGSTDMPAVMQIQTGMMWYIANGHPHKNITWVSVVVMDQVNYYISGNFMDQKDWWNSNQDTYKRYTGTGKSMHNWLIGQKVNYTSRRRHAKIFIVPPIWPMHYSATWHAKAGPHCLYMTPTDTCSTLLLRHSLRDGGKHNIQTDNIYQQISYSWTDKELDYPCGL